MSDNTSNPQNTPPGNQPAPKAGTSEQPGATSAEVVPTFDGVPTGSAAPVLVLDRIEAFLHEQGLGAGPVEWGRAGGGAERGRHCPRARATWCAGRACSRPSPRRASRGQGFWRWAKTSRSWV